MMMKNVNQLFHSIYTKVHNYSPNYSTPSLDILEVEEFTKIGIDETMMIYEKAREIKDRLECLKNSKQKNLSEDKIEKNWEVIQDDLLDIISLTMNVDV